MRAWISWLTIARRAAARDDVRPGYRAFHEGRHLIFYREAGDQIEIIRILHDRMDFRRHFPGDQG